MQNRAEKVRQMLTFLSVSKAHTNKLYIFQQYMYIVYIDYRYVIFLLKQLRIMKLFENEEIIH